MIGVILMSTGLKMICGVGVLVVVLVIVFGGCAFNALYQANRDSRSKD